MTYSQLNSYFKSSHFIKNNKNYKLVDLTRKIEKAIVDSDTKKMWVYRGQIDANTNKPDGIGILVESKGSKPTLLYFFSNLRGILEGWKDEWLRQSYIIIYDSV